MKLPLSWINEYTDISDISYKQYEHALTMSGSKVEGFEDMAKDIVNVKTGKIISMEKHPDADRLTVCQVNMGEKIGVIQIVTAATNMKENDIVTPFHYIPLHLSKVCEKYGYKKGDLPVTEEYSERLVRLPLHAKLTDKDVDKVIKTVKEFFDKNNYLKS